MAARLSLRVGPFLFVRLAGGWSDVDADMLIDDIHKTRSSNRPRVRL
jgi:hypothetical protein